MRLTNAPAPEELDYTDLRWQCKPSVFKFSSTSEIEPIEGIVGQDRALKALKLGVGLKSPGYNIYVSGLSGTGKLTTVKKILETIDGEKPELLDYVYVYNFNDPDYPLLLMFPAGEAKKFKRDLSDFISYLKEKVPQLLESKSFSQKKNQLIDTHTKDEQNLLNKFEKQLKSDGFTLGQIQTEVETKPDVLPIVNDKPVAIFQIQQLVDDGKLSEKDADQIFDKYEKYQEELQQIFKRGMKLNQELQIKISDMERKEVGALIKGAIRAFSEKYVDEKLQLYFNGLETFILENLILFKLRKDEVQPDFKRVQQFHFRKFEVNIILDNSKTDKAPVIIEISPSHSNILGTIEKVSDGHGGWHSDFTNIKAGSLLRANGGYLVINATHLFENPVVWKSLKRVLTYRKLDIQDSYNAFPLAQTSLKPEPIDINAKVLLIGSSYIYSMLAGYEDDFKKIFKVKAEFDYEVKRDDDLLLSYARVIKKMIKEEDLLEFDRKAIASIMEYAARYAGKKDKLTSRFSMLADLAREANYWAIEDQSPCVHEKHIHQAYNEAKYRHGLYDEKMKEMIQEDVILIDTQGEKTGQVNGLAVYGTEMFSYGKPVKITASVSLGNGNIVNVEREAGLSGKSYNKAMLIITGYLKETFGQKHPLTFSANIVFEQSYGLIDGDSASAAEMCALISSLTHIPVTQSLAITGSMNQRGDIQPIGGVNEKIEGFYRICKERGLTKDQGIIIPHQNIKDLMLSEEVVQSVKDGEFHIYPIKHIEEAVEMYMGKKCSQKTRTGAYSKKCVYGILEQNLAEMYRKVKSSAKPHTHAVSKKQSKQTSKSSERKTKK